MRMDAEDNGLPVFKMPVHPLNLIRIHVGRIHFHCGRQVDNNGIFSGRPPGFLHRSADLQGKIQFRPGKAFGRIFQNNLSGKCSGAILHHLRPFHRDIDDFFTGSMKYHIPLQS